MTATTAKKKKDFVTFLPNLRADDQCANYWLHQVMIRLRRELWWCWRERGVQPVGDPATLPPFSDRVSTTLDFSRFWIEKQDFYKSDPTARYLTEQLTNEQPPAGKKTERGSFAWIIKSLDLKNVDAFVLALGLIVALDSSAGSVISACLNDQTKTLPSLALAQRLWDDPDHVFSVADPLHALFRLGLIRYAENNGPRYSDAAWDAPITVPPIVAKQLLFPQSGFPHGMALLDGQKTELSEVPQLVSIKLNHEPDRLRLVPVIGATGSSRHETVGAIAKANKKKVLDLNADPDTIPEGHLNSIATVCWLKDTYLFLSRELRLSAKSGDHHSHHSQSWPAPGIPVTVFLSLSEDSQLSELPSDLLLPSVRIPPLTYDERRNCWKKYLKDKTVDDALIGECARRFRFEKETISDICNTLNQLSGMITAKELLSACRMELDTKIGELASRVQPRFKNEELILPQKQQLLFEEIRNAMTSLTEVHYSWGTAQAWNESGISVLFAGPPGTGKTMAAEILAIQLDLPMYRIDLSQVVNKYIGETEKNLKRVFDAADMSDMILFFDEADSLFGRRTEVSDAHDRYANLEISYLLERMERFKGLAILATNRKKDLDEAFLRRLRYIVDFPLPDVPERKRIWQQVIPEHADGSEIQFDFLAQQFQLSGGNIRSIVFNACLHCANGSGSNGTHAGRLTMEGIIVAVKREYDKLNRSLSLQQYGSYAPVVERLGRD